MLPIAVLLCDRFEIAISSVVWKFSGDEPHQRWHIASFRVWSCSGVMLYLLHESCLHFLEINRMVQGEAFFEALDQARRDEREEVYWHTDRDLAIPMHMLSLGMWNCD